MLGTGTGRTLVVRDEVAARVPGPGEPISSQSTFFRDRPGAKLALQRTARARLSGGGGHGSRLRSARTSIAHTRVAPDHRWSRTTRHGQHAAFLCVVRQ